MYVIRSSSDDYKVSIGLRLTNACNYRCRHCCYEAGPDGNVMELSTLEKVMAHLPTERLKDVEMTGGEILIPKNREVLEYTAGYLRRNRPDVEKVSISTSGWWTSTEDLAYKTLSYVHDLGISCIRITGHDVWHREQGLATYKINANLEKTIDRLKAEGKEMYIQHSKNHRDIAGLGRGKNIQASAKKGFAIVYPDDDESFRSRDPGCAVGFDFYYRVLPLHVDPKGNVSLCCYEKLPPICSALDMHMDDIIKLALADPFMKEVLELGPQRAAEKTGFPDASGVNRWNECYFCDNVLSHMTFAELQKGVMEAKTARVNKKLEI